MNSSPPVMRRPPAPVMSITTSSVNTSRIPAQSFVSISRKYRAFSRRIASTSSMPVRAPLLHVLDVLADVGERRQVARVRLQGEDVLRAAVEDAVVGLG